MKLLEWHSAALVCLGNCRFYLHQQECSNSTADIYHGYCNRWKRTQKYGLYQNSCQGRHVSSPLFASFEGTMGQSHLQQCFLLTSCINVCRKSSSHEHNYVLLCIQKPTKLPDQLQKVTSVVDIRQGSMLDGKRKWSKHGQVQHDIQSSRKWW